MCDNADDPCPWPRDEREVAAASNLSASMGPLRCGAEQPESPELVPSIVGIRYVRFTSTPAVYRGAIATRRFWRGERLRGTQLPWGKVAPARLSLRAMLPGQDFRGVASQRLRPRGFPVAELPGRLFRRRSRPGAFELCGLLNELEAPEHKACGQRRLFWTIVETLIDLLAA